MNTPKKYDALIISCITFCICFISYLILNQEYIFSDFLTEDDNIFVPKAMFGVPEYISSTVVQDLQFFLIDITSIFKSVPIMRLFLLVIASLNAVFISLIFSKYIKGIFFPAFLGVSIVTIPISADQIIFITGSHPTLSLFFIIISLFLFDNIYKYKGLSFIFYNIAILIVLFLAILSSPIGFMAPIALMFWLIIARFFIKDLGGMSFKEWLLFLSGITLLCAFIYIYAGLLKHHYTGQTGKVNFTIQQVSQNVLGSIDKVIDIYGNYWESAFILFTIGIGLLAILALCAFFKNCSQTIQKNDTQLLIIGFNALIISAFTFAPSSVTSDLLDRYIVPPVTLFVISLAAFVIYLYPKNILVFRWQNLVVVMALLFITSANAIRTKETLNEHYSTQLDTHHAVQKFVNEYKSIWTDDAQVVIFTSGKERSTTMGYIHWSTWYLRYMTGNLNIIGLIGRFSENYPLIKKFPFIEGTYDEVAEQRDNSKSQFWGVLNGRSYHLQMFGIEKERPLFAYQQNEEGKFESVEYILFSSKEGVNIVPFGQSYQEAKEQPIQLQQLCKQESNVFMWSTTQASGYNSSVSFTHESNLLNSDKLVFDGLNSVSIKINIPEHEYFRLEFRLTNLSEINSVVFNETSPPMPILTPAFALYQYPSSSMHFVNRKNSESYVVDETNSNQIDVFFEGISDCAILFGFNNKLRGILTNQSLNGNWLLGKGYKNRYWNGKFDKMILKTLD